MKKYIVFSNLIEIGSYVTLKEAKEIAVNETKKYDDTVTIQKIGYGYTHMVKCRRIYRLTPTEREFAHRIW